MCGRYALFTPVETLIALFEVAGVPAAVSGLVARYNIAPSQRIAVVRQDGGHKRELAMVNWGFVPAWSQDPLHPTRTGGPPINARSETAATSPVFRSAFRSRRCLVPSDGFYEWLSKPDPTSGEVRKRPMFIHMRTGEPMAMGGLWERWEPRNGVQGEAMETCAILTTRPNALMSGIHTRMPVIVPRSGWARWLDGSADVSTLLDPIEDGVLEARAVSRLVNSPRSDSPDVLRAEPDHAPASHRRKDSSVGDDADGEGTLWGKGGMGGRERG